jgi:hypothetical protein
MRMKFIDFVWPWGRIKRLKIALNQALEDNQLLADKLSELTDRDERGRFVKKSK